MRDFVRGQGKAAILAIGLASILVVGILDYLAGSQIPLTVIYLLPIFMVAWQAGEGAGLLLALLGTATWWAASRYTGRLPTSSLAVLWQLLSMAAMAGAAAVLAARLHKARSRTQALSLVDFLTGALNSRAFYNILENEHRKSARYERPMTLVYIGLDHFKRINDRFGHTTGDTVLLKVARSMMKCLRATDRVARLGGDEFIVLLPETGREAARKVVPKICERLAMEMEDNGWPITLSVSVITYIRVPPSAREMIKMSEKLMRVVKKGGKNAVRYASYKG
jgi:diguanylate cyclase (GGDEF)-like protein